MILFFSGLRKQVIYPLSSTNRSFYRIVTWPLPRSEIMRFYGVLSCAANRSAPGQRGINSMRWQLTISDKNPKKPPVSVTVEGDDWFTAFEAGLKKQPSGGGLVGSLRCALHPGKILKIIDILSQKSYDLRPVDRAGNPTAQNELTPAADRVPSPPIPPPPETLALGADTISAFERMQSVTALGDRRQVAEFGLSLTMELIPCQTGLCILQTSGKKELHWAAKKGQRADLFPAEPVDLDVGVVGFAMRMGAVVTVSRSGHELLPAAEYLTPPAYETTNTMCAPLQFEGRTAGAMLLLNSLKESGFSQSDTNTLSYLAGALAEYLEKSLPVPTAGSEGNVG